MTKKDFTGKKISDITGIHTKLLGFGNMESEELENINKTNNKVLKNFDYKEKGRIGCLVVYDSDIIVCFQDNISVAMFPVYEVSSPILDEKHKVIIVLGHEELIHYWFEDGSFDHNYTR